MPDPDLAEGRRVAGELVEIRDLLARSGLLLGPPDADAVARVAILVQTAQAYQRAYARQAAQLGYIRELFAPLMPASVEPEGTLPLLDGLYVAANNALVRRDEEGASREAVIAAGRAAADALQRRMAAYRATAGDPGDLGDLTVPPAPGGTSP